MNSASRANTFLKDSWLIAFFIFSLSFVSSFLLLQSVVHISATFSFFLSVFFANLATILTQRYRIWHFFGLYFGKVSIYHFLYGILIALVSQLPVFVLLLFFGVEFKDINVLIFFESVSMILFSATTEELLFRGVLFQRLIDKLGEAKAIFFSSIVFSLAHIQNPSINTLAMLNLFLGGVVLGVMYIRTYILWLPIGFHFGWNFFQYYLLGSPVSGHYHFEPFVISKITEFEPIVFGGNFGLEGGVASTLLLILVVIYISKAFVPTPIIISRILRERYARMPQSSRE
ncbi:MAG: CPBP family intramembrane metalloprotease [Ignavibacteria bacterium]|nr:CPBP family intramembrane metalloprotease [Ignavibacteria bacterium]